MNIVLDRKSKVPFYIQIKEQIINIIKNEEIKDLRLPTQRELSENLKVSRNTVSMAYAELEKEGVIDIFVGKGTFLSSPDKDFLKLNKNELLKRNIENSLENALELGFSIEEYFTIVKKYVNEKKEMMNYIKLVFVECNFEQTNYYSTHLQLDPHIKIIPIVLFDIKNNKPGIMKNIDNADFIVTSFYHINELKNILKKQSDKIIAISLSPEMSTIVDIARIPKTSNVCIITSSKQFMEDIEKVLDKLKINFKDMSKLIEPSNFQFNKALEKADTFILSPQWRKKVEKSAERRQKKIKLIEFVYTPDNTSIKNLKIKLFELRKNKEA